MREQLSSIADARGAFPIARRREFIVDFSVVPGGAKATLQSERQVTLTHLQAKKYLRSLVTNALEG